jgi:maltose O-acetyltransferase
MVMPGVHIGSHCIIGAGAIVTKDIPDWAIAAGSPAVVKKYRNRSSNVNSNI